MCGEIRIRGWSCHARKHKKFILKGFGHVEECTSLGGKGEGINACLARVERPACGVRSLELGDLKMMCFFGEQCGTNVDEINACVNV